MLEIPQLREAKLPAVLFSGGKDSLLLLDVARKIRSDVTPIHFYERLHPEVEDVIKSWNLEVLSWRPAAHYLIPFGADIALVNEYSFGNARLPVLCDLIDGEDCQLENRRKDRTDFFDNPFTDIFWGMKKCDELHPVMPPYFEREVQLGTSRLIAPLYKLTDEQVIAEIEQRGLPYRPFADTVTACSKCREWLSTDWDDGGALTYFARRFGYDPSSVAPTVLGSEAVPVSRSETTIGRSCGFGVPISPTDHATAYPREGVNIGVGC